MSEEITKQEELRQLLLAVSDARAKLDQALQDIELFYREHDIPGLDDFIDEYCPCVGDESDVKALEALVNEVKACPSYGRLPASVNDEKDDG